MVITDKVYITDPLEEDLVAGGGQFVTYPEVTKDKARAHLATHVRNLTDKDQTLSVFSQLVDSVGHVIAEAETPVTLHKQSDRTVEQDLIVNQPALWHPYTPNLYTLRTQLLSEDKVLDETTRKSVFVRSGTRPRKDSLSMVKTVYARSQPSPGFCQCWGCGFQLNAGTGCDRPETGWL